MLAAKANVAARCCSHTSMPPDPSRSRTTVAAGRIGTADSVGPEVKALADFDDQLHLDGSIQRK